MRLIDLICILGADGSFLPPTFAYLHCDAETWSTQESERTSSSTSETYPDLARHELRRLQSSEATRYI